MVSKKILPLVVCLFLATVSAQAGTLIQIQQDSVITSMNGAIGNWATFGQVFQTPADNVLDSFSFYAENVWNATGPLTLRGYVAAWNGTRATGPMLYRSDPVTTGFPVTGNQMLHFNINGLSLTTGQKYVAFLSAVEHPDSDINHSLAIGINYFGGDTYGPGTLVGKVNFGGGLPELTSQAWADKDSGIGIDMATELNFVPEPATMSLLALGAMAVLRRRKS